MLVFLGENVGACLNLAGRSTRLTQEMLGLRIMVMAQVYKSVKGGEKSWNGTTGLI